MINPKIKRRWLIIKTYVIGWTIAFVFLCIIRGVGTIELALQPQFDFLSSVIASLVLGPTFGCISAFVQILTEEKVNKRTPIRRLLLLKFIYTIIFMFALIVAGYAISKLFFGLTDDFVEFAFHSGSLAIYFYVVLVEIFMSILIQINLMFGGNRLAQLLKGKFYTTREEERIFMFLDMQSSTALAEKLGHIKFRTLVQDCFNDLGIVMENNAEIYQYVGDEAILTWKLQEGVKNQNCIRAYFNFMEMLNRNKTSYLKKYNCIPYFKAGMHYGMVTVTEVGKYKKEIAFYGDTLNTAARIQSKCNELDKGLLISESLKNKLDNSKFGFDKIGNVILRGKKRKVTIYAASKYNGQV